MIKVDKVFKLHIHHVQMNGVISEMTVTQVLKAYKKNCISAKLK